MGNFFFNPALVVAGLVAVSVPIIIHLLNRRRFRRVDWAPMDFLLKAQQINRRRIKFEDFLLLLLRCLAVAFIGMLVARPFLPNDKSGALRKLARFERVIVLDDSLSMDARSSGVSAMESARELLRNWIRQLSAERPDDTVTLVLSSSPEKPIANGVPLSEAAAAELLQEVDELKTADASQDLEEALRRLEKLFADDGRAQANRVLYVLTDLRRRDWPPSGGGVFESLSRIAGQAAGSYVVDLGGDQIENLAIESIVPLEKAFVAGAPAEFEVVVRNFGERAANDVMVRLGTADGLPVEKTIERIESGQTGVAGFVYTFGSAEEGEKPEPVDLRAEIVPEPGTSADVLEADNERFFAARVSEGLRVLVVDGDIAAKPENSDSFFLGKALSPRGSIKSGFTVTVIDDAAIATEALDEYDVVVLANVFRMNGDRREKIEAWTRAGGGLLVALGDQVDASVYNGEFFGADGLIPVRLVGIEGDSSEETWRLPILSDDNHPAFRFFTGENRRWLERVKFFQWWKLEAIESEEGDDNGENEEGGQLRILARLGAESADPLLVESEAGGGRIMVLASSVDLDWNTWAQEGVPYVIAIQELCRYLARSNALRGELAAGDPLEVAFDIAQFRMDADISLPDGETRTVRAVPESEGGQDSEWALQFPGTERRGFYRVELTRTGSGDAKDVRLFAVNADPAEGDLRKDDRDRVAGLLETSGAKLVGAGEPVLALGGVGARIEFWKGVLYLLIGLLCVEMCYAWWLGNRR